MILYQTQGNITGMWLQTMEFMFSLWIVLATTTNKDKFLNKTPVISLDIMDQG